MEKLLIAFCLLIALSGTPGSSGEPSGTWEMRLRAGNALRIDLRVEALQPVECDLILRGQTLRMTYSRHRCLWRPCHA